MFQLFVAIILWLARKSYWWVEFDPAEDKAFRVAINAKCDDGSARKVLSAVVSEDLPASFSEDFVLEQLISRFVPGPSHADTQDSWIRLMQRLQELHGMAEDGGEKARFRDVMNLLNAYNRDRETKKHRELAEGDSITARRIKDTNTYCERQLGRMDTGVARIPVAQKGSTMPAPEMICFFLVLLCILAINCGTEAISFSLEEYIGFARNGVGRPRTLYQTAIAILWFDLTDGWFLWEIGRQRSLGAILSFILYMIASLYRPIYGKTPFVISSGVASTLFQIVVQLGDLVWSVYTRLQAGNESRPSLSWQEYLYLSMRGRLPASDEDQKIYAELKKLNARSAAWAKGFRKSKSMSLWWMLYASSRATPRTIFAARAGIKAKRTYDLAFWQKVVFPILTGAIWVISAYATWGQWYIFTIINAFHAIAFMKGLDIAFSPEQEVHSAVSTFCNMVGAGAPTLFGVLIPSAASRSYLDAPRKLAPVMSPLFVATFWTDLIADTMMKLPELFSRGSSASELSGETAEACCDAGNERGRPCRTGGAR
jgi:hypothetical protein